jgi:putative thioredoxin
MSTKTPSPHVIDVTDETFEAEVLDRSNETTVVVDFWATWCAPCKTLGPLLEKLAEESAGSFLLAKVDTERAPRVAQDFGVRTIPTVYAVRDGRVIDGFVGALPESTLRAWLEGVLPTPGERLAAEGRRLEPTDAVAAEARFREALAREPEIAAAAAGLARVLIRQGKADEARGLIDGLESRGFLEPEAEAVKAELALHVQSASTGGVEASRAALAAAPDDPARKLALAEALAAARQFEDSLGLALAVVEDGRKDDREQARRVMVNIFQLLPPDSELAAEYRRKLSAALY